MNISPESFISHKLIIADIINKSGDREFKYDSEGYYMGLIQEALQELSFDTFFLETEKVYKLEDGCLKLTLPSGAFNVKGIFGFSGNECTTTNSKPIFWKKDYKNGIANDTWENSGSPYYKQRGTANPPGNLFYAGISNGVVHLSPNCKSFENVVIRFNGLITDIGEVPVIPMFFRQAVIDYVVVEALSSRMVNNPTNKAIVLWQTVMNRHDGRLRLPYDGSWAKAQDRVKSMDSKSRQDLKEYFSRLDY